MGDATAGALTPEERESFAKAINHGCSAFHFRTEDVLRLWAALAQAERERDAALEQGDPAEQAPQFPAMSPGEATAMHGMYFHLHGLAQSCGVANQGDWPRWSAALDVRNYCSRRMRELVSHLAAAAPPPEEEASRE